MRPVVMGRVVVATVVVVGMIVGGLLPVEIPMGVGGEFLAAAFRAEVIGDPLEIESRFADAEADGHAADRIDGRAGGWRLCMVMPVMTGMVRHHCFSRI